MRIEFFEGDELTQPDGKPKHIYLSIEGHKMILPTDKTILDILELGKGYEPPKEPIVEIPSTKPLQGMILQDSAKTNEIEREDLVTCVKVLPRGEGANVDIVEGGTYRVLSILRQSFMNEQGQATTTIKFYEVIDDSAPVQRRIQVYPSEVVLCKKHGPMPKPIYKFEEIYPCGYCGEPNALVLDSVKNKYVGECKKCHKALETERPSAKSTA